MRVLCRTLDESELEGEVIGGYFYDEGSGEIDLAEIFNLRLVHASFIRTKGLSSPEFPVELFREAAQRT